MMISRLMMMMMRLMTALAVAFVHLCLGQLTLLLLLLQLIRAYPFDADCCGLCGDLSCQQFAAQFKSKSHCDGQQQHQ